MAHVRRKFVEAGRIAQGRRGAKLLGHAERFVKAIKEIYRTDREIRKEATTLDQLTTRRRAEVVPQLEQLLEDTLTLQPVVTPKSKLGKALAYAARTLPSIIKYADCPQLRLDNNDIENHIRPFAIGRKNWLMANTPAVGHALAIWFTLIQTAKANGWRPDQYLTHLFNGILNGSPFIQLLPTKPPPRT